MIFKILLVFVICKLLFIDHIEAIQLTRSTSIQRLEFAVSQLELDPDTAFFESKLIYLQSIKSNDTYLQAKSGLVLGKVLFNQGSFEEALEYLQHAAGIFRSLKNSKELAECYIWLGAVYQYSKQYITAKKYYEDAFDMFSSINDQRGKGIAMAWLGHYFEKMGEFEKAIYYQQVALNTIPFSKGHSADKADVYDNLGSLYEDLLQYDSAEYYFRKAYSVNDSLNRGRNKIVNLNNLGDVFRKTGELDLALQIGDSVVEMSKRIHLKYQVRSGYKDLSKAYALKGDYEQSYLYLDSALTLHQDIFDHEKIRRMTHLKFAFETDLKEQRIATLEKEQTIILQRSTFIGVACGIILVVVTLVFLAKKQKLKINKKIVKQKEKLVSVEQELLLTDLKNSMLSEQNLKNEIKNKELVEQKLRENLSQKGQSLTNQTLALIRNNNFLEGIRDDLKDLKNRPKQETAKAINKLIANISQNFVREEDWNDFQSVFEDIHSDYFKLLREEFPNLSPTELRLCALLKLNLNSTDISTIMGISIDSLRVARYRLRKKLNLDKGGNLVTFLVGY